MARGVEDRRAKRHDAGQHGIDHAGGAALAHLGQHGVYGLGGERQVLALDAAGLVHLGLQQRGRDLARQPGREAAPGGRGQHGHDVAQAQVGGDRLRAFLPVHDGRPVVAPDGDGRRVVDALHERGHAFARQPHGVQPGQRCQAQLERGRAQVVAGGARVLGDQADALEAHEVAVRLGGAHAGVGRQVLEHLRAPGARQRLQQCKTDLDRLNPCAFLVHCNRIWFCLVKSI